jgi:hypothetical protein
MVPEFSEVMSEIKHQRVNDGDQGVEIEEDEEFLSVDAHTVVDPRTMMVHEGDASPTVSAVMGMGWLH